MLESLLPDETQNENVEKPVSVPFRTKQITFLEFFDKYPSAREDLIEMMQRLRIADTTKHIHHITVTIGGQKYQASWKKQKFTALKIASSQMIGRLLYIAYFPGMKRTVALVKMFQLAEDPQLYKLLPLKRYVMRSSEEESCYEILDITEQLKWDKITLIPDLRFPQEQFWFHDTKIVETDFRRIDPKNQKVFPWMSEQYLKSFTCLDADNMDLNSSDEESANEPEDSDSDDDI